MAISMATLINFTNKLLDEEKIKNSVYFMATRDVQLSYINVYTAEEIIQHVKSEKEFESHAKLIFLEINYENENNINKLINTLSLYDSTLEFILISTNKYETNDIIDNLSKKTNLTVVKNDISFSSLKHLINNLIKKYNIEKSKIRLFDNIEQDLKSPLASLIGFAKLLKEESILGKTDSSFINFIIKNSFVLKLQIDDLITLSQNEHNDFKVFKNETKIHNLFNSIQAMTTSLLKENKNNIDIKFLNSCNNF